MEDLKYALRGLARSPGFTLIAILTLALGIGANTAIFTVAKQVLLDPLDYPESERMVAVLESNLEAGFPRFSLSPPNYADFRDRSESYESVAALTGGSYNLTGEGIQPERLAGLQVTAEYFDVYATPPMIGRAIDAKDDQPSADKVVVLGHGLWQRHFGGDESAVGQTLALNGEPHTVIGVMPPGFIDSRDLFVPLAMEIEEDMRGAHFLGMRGRLKPGVTAEQADAEIKRIAAGLAREYPDTNTGWSAFVAPLRDLAVDDFGGVVALLLAAVGLVLLVACANVANLMLGRLAARERDVAVRAALGAGRGRLIRLFLTESTVLGLAGGALGTLLAWRGTSMLVAMSSGDIPRADEIAVDGEVLLFALGLSLLTSLIFGLLPAFQASRGDLQSTLKEGGRGAAGGAGGRRLKSALVVAEVAISVILLVGAGLLLRSLARLTNVDPGFDPRSALTATLELPDSRYGEDADKSRFYDRLFERLAQLPGVDGVGAVVPMPLTGSGFILTFYVEGTPLPEPNKAPFSNIRVVNRDYFDTMAIPVLRGRAFTRDDTMDRPWSVVINRSTAEKYFPGQDPLGQRMTFDDPADEDLRWMTVVGVVGDVHHEELAAATDPEIYWSYAQRPVDEATLVLRAAGEPLSLTAPLRAAIADVDPALAASEIRTLERIVDDSVARPRFNSLLIGLFAGVALTLAVIGVYCVISYAVAQRQREIGVRLALGARRGGILGLVLKTGMHLVLLGLGLGLVAAVFTSRLLESMMFEVSPVDPSTFAGVALTLGLVGAAACLFPALRAIRVDPVVVLREE